MKVIIFSTKTLLQSISKKRANFLISNCEELRDDNLTSNCLTFRAGLPLSIYLKRKDFCARTKTCIIFLSNLSVCDLLELRACPLMHEVNVFSLLPLAESLSRQ